MAAAKMNRVDRVEIDPIKLKRELTKRGLTTGSASRSMGYSDGYLTNCMGDYMIKVKGGCFVSQVCVRLMYEMFNIRPESILPDPKPEPKKEAPNQNADRVADMTSQDLYAIVYKAVYEAMKMALKGE